MSDFFPKRRAQIARWSAAFLGAIPLLSGLRIATAKALKRALIEFLFFWFLSTLPLLLAILGSILQLKSLPGSSEISAILVEHFKFGEVFIYVNALLAPVAFVLYKYNRDGFKFHNYLAFLISLIAVLPTSAFLYSMQRLQSAPNLAVLMPLAAAAYAYAVLLRYLSLVYDNVRLDYMAEQRGGEKSLIDELKDFKGS
jgi:hypothetical protein